MLDFASARNPGGGYLRGAKAQEEDLCRESLLHPGLIRAGDAYYEPHRASDDLNAPEAVALAFHQQLHGTELGSCFDNVVFAVRDRTLPSANHTAFTRQFAG